MSKSATLKHSIRFQEWVAQVEEFNARPEGMSMTAWCKQQGIAVSTFITRLHKVQDRYLEQTSNNLPLPVASNEKGTVPSTTFVELPVISKVESTSSVAVITCGKARIEITEDVSETFLLKLIGAVCHAQ